MPRWRLEDQILQDVRILGSYEQIFLGSVTTPVICYMENCPFMDNLVTYRFKMLVNC